MVYKFQTSELDEYNREFIDATRKFEKIVYNLNSEQFNWAPEEDHWSIAECIQHLNITAQRYFLFMVPAIEKRLPRPSMGNTVESPKRRPLFGRWLLSALNPRKKRRLSAPKIFKPEKKEYLLNTVCTEFRRIQEQFIDLLQKCDDLDLDRTCFRTPVSPLVRVNLNQAFAIHSIHEHRHLDQAQRVRESQGFPTS